MIGYVFFLGVSGCITIWEKDLQILHSILDLALIPLTVLENDTLSIYSMLLG